MRLKREFRYLADINHPNIVGLHELVCHEGTWFFTMEMVAGPDFIACVRSSRLRSAPTVEMTQITPSDTEVACEVSSSTSGILNEQTLRSVLGQLAWGVLALHAEGIVHCDLKPSNILVASGEANGEAGTVKIVDFGLSRRRGASSGSKRIEGTPAYMAPEQARGDVPSEAADWYAVGVILYEALTGMLPFEGTLEDVLTARQTREPHPPHTVSPGIPRDLADLTMRLLHRDPAQRAGGDDILNSLNLDPAELKQLRESLRRRVSDRPLARGLIGRDEELNTIRAAARSISTNQCTAFYLHGASGHGKTVLAQQAVQELSRSGARVFVSRCYERETSPYKAVDGMVDQLAALAQSEQWRGQTKTLCANLAAVFPAFKGSEELSDAVDPVERRAAAFRSLRPLLSLFCDRPLVLLIDDAQWADADSLPLLTEAFREPNAPKCLLLITSRGSASNPKVPCRVHDALSDAGLNINILDVGPLSPANAEKLAADRLARHSPALVNFAAKIAAESLGNPYFVEELVRSVGRSQGQSPVALTHLLRSRVTDLDENQTTLLQLVCVSDGPVSREVLYRVVGGPGGPHALRALRAAHLVAASGFERSVEPYHDQVRESVRDAMSDETMKRLHDTLADALMDGQSDSPDAPLERIAHHLAAAGKSEEAVKFLEQAGKRAHEALAFDHAVSLFQKALTLTAGSTTQLLGWLASALAASGRSFEAANTYLEAAERDHPNALDFRRRGAELLLKSGRVTEGRKALEEVLRHYDINMPRGTKRALASAKLQRLVRKVGARTYRKVAEEHVPEADLGRIDALWSAASGFSMVDIPLSREFQARHLRYAGEVGEPYRLVRALCIEAAHVSFAGPKSAPRVKELLSRAEAVNTRSPHPHARALIQVALGIHNRQIGDFKQGRIYTERALSLLRRDCVGVTWETAATLRYHCLALLYTGRYKELAELTLTESRAATRREDNYACRALVCSENVLGWMVFDRVNEARIELTRLSQPWNRTNFDMTHYNSEHALAILDCYEGNFELAYQRCLTIEEPFARRKLGIAVVLEQSLLRWKAVSALGCANPETRRRGKEAAQALRGNEGPLSMAHAELLRSVADFQSGNPMAAIEAAQRARAGFASSTELMSQVADYCVAVIGDDAAGQAKLLATLQASGIAHPKSFIRTLAPIRPKS